MNAFTVILLTSATVVANNAGADTSVGFSTAVDQLSNSTPDWHETKLAIQRKYGLHHVGGIAISRTERFGFQDEQIGVYYAKPFGKKLVAVVNADVSTTHRILPKYAYGATAQYEFAPAWLIHSGARTIKYDAVRVNQALLMLEHYVSSFSWSTSWRPTRAFGTLAHSRDVRINYYYADKSQTGLLFASGQEAARLEENVSLTTLRSVAVIGRHWVNERFALNYNITHTRQGNIYIRNGLSIGLDYAF